MKHNNKKGARQERKKWEKETPYYTQDKNNTGQDQTGQDSTRQVKSR
jgi:hypothetical protein